MFRLCFSTLAFLSSLVAFLASVGRFALVFDCLPVLGYNPFQATKKRGKPGG